jgi:hypothetical protein
MNEETNLQEPAKPALNIASVSNSLICKPINDGDFIQFVDFTERLGRAEFTVCPQFKRGKLVRLSIYPRQQEDRGYFLLWETNGKGKNHYTVQGYEGLDEPYLWTHHWCKKHKCQSFTMYVPRGAKFLWFSVFSDNVCIGFTKTSWQRS